MAMSGHALADLVDHPGDVATCCLRELCTEACRTCPRAELGVCCADSGRVHNDPDLTGTWMRIGKIHDFQDPRGPQIG